MFDSAIRLEGLTKQYGRRRGIRDLTFEVYQGEVFGYLGPNGAGKTTTIRLLLDLLRPTAGQARVLGMDPHLEGLAVRRLVGYLPGELQLYESMTGRDLLRYFAHLRDGAGGIGFSRAQELAERFDLDLSRPIRELSRGNKQKVGLVQAFMHDPKLLLLDEPTSGLDPLVQQEFHRLVREVVTTGGTVFLSSHVLSEVERIAHRVAIIREGSLVVVEELDALKLKARRRLEIHFARPVSPEPFAALPNVEGLSVDGRVVRCVVVGEVDSLIKAAARFQVVNVLSEEADLEDLFLAYYRGSGDAP